MHGLSALYGWAAYAAHGIYIFKATPPILCLLYYFGLPLPDSRFSQVAVLWTPFIVLPLSLFSSGYLLWISSNPSGRFATVLAVSLECAQPQPMAFSIVSKLPY